MNETSPLHRTWHWVKARFSLRGRASRREFWLTFPLALLCCGLGFVVTAATGVALHVAFAHFHVSGGAVVTIVCVLLGLLSTIIYVWLCLAVAIRRTQDLGFSYRESFRLRVNIAGAFKRGTIGPNDYGPDPLQKGDIA